MPGKGTSMPYKHLHFITHISASNAFCELGTDLWKNWQQAKLSLLLRYTKNLLQQQLV